MGKQFGNAATAAKIADIAKKSNQAAKVVSLKMIADENLIDYPENHEDVTRTIDLETSMQENGFTDPMEVTDFGMDEGKYMILSGHRRRMAGRKVGFTEFPCIVKSFSNENAVKNYVLLANNYRDSDDDPLLRARRYKMHEDYLIKAGEKGEIGKKVALRMGLSKQQADRYKAFCKVVSPVWDMVQGGVVGMSSIIPMATHTESEQGEILEMLNDCLAAGNELTRDTCKKIIDAYRNGVKKYADIITQGETASQLNKDSGMPLNAFMNTDPGETRDPSEHGRNGEVRREFDPIAANADAMDRDKADYEEHQAGQQSQQNEDSNGNDDKESKDKKEPLTDDEKEAQQGLRIMASIEKLPKLFDEIYTFEDADTAELTIKNMASALKTVIDEMYEISQEYKTNDAFKSAFTELRRKINEYE